jgi:hypothetical protein
MKILNSQDAIRLRRAKCLDEKVASLHLAKIGAKDEAGGAKVLGVPQVGPSRQRAIGIEGGHVQMFIGSHGSRRI